MGDVTAVFRDRAGALSRDKARGNIDGASVHPREVVYLALARNAAAVIVADNYPSGVADYRAIA
jgi:hypothetical protein